MTIKTTNQTKTVVLVTAGEHKDKLLIMLGMAKEELLNVFSRNKHTGFFMCPIEEEFLTASLSKKVVVYGDQIEPIELSDEILLQP